MFIELFNFSFFSVTGWGIDLDYCDIEWFALEMNIYFYWENMKYLEKKNLKEFSLILDESPEDDSALLHSKLFDYQGS